jgi:hypothetical protein
MLGCQVAVFDHNLLGFDDKIGSTELDLEDRIFSPEWKTEHKEKPPIEKRTLYAKGYPQGCVWMFVEILSLAESALPQFKQIDISPPPDEKFELRLICWEIKDVNPDLDWSGLADLYVLTFLTEGGDDVTKRLRTDTHFRAQEQKAAWNWRFKMPITLRHNIHDPRHPPWRLHLQLWDMDINFNDFAGATELHLDKWFQKIYGKCVACHTPPQSAPSKPQPDQSSAQCDATTGSSRARATGISQSRICRTSMKGLRTRSSFLTGRIMAGFLRSTRPSSWTPLRMRRNGCWGGVPLLPRRRQAVLMRRPSSGCG